MHIQILRLNDVSCGDFLGYYAGGHHDSADFCLAISKQLDEKDFSSDTKLQSFSELENIKNKIKQTYYRWSFDPDKNLVFCETEKGKGAFPVTVLLF